METKYAGKKSSTVDVGDDPNLDLKEEQSIYDEYKKYLDSLKKSLTI